MISISHLFEEISPEALQRAKNYVMKQRDAVRNAPTKPEATGAAQNLMKGVTLTRKMGEKINRPILGR